MNKPLEPYLKKMYIRLFAKYGPQSWWPAQSRFEITIGAVLTQNTNWTNVTKAIANLRRENLLTPSALKSIPLKNLSQWIKPAGYFNVKAKRLKNFVDFLFKEYDGRLDRMAEVPLEELRKKLLSVNGIGPETADSILLYALDKPVFVVDAYTKRILSRHHLIDKDAPYHEVQKKFTENLTTDAKMFNEYHALIVRLAKDNCRTKPRCEQCPLKDINYPRFDFRSVQGRKT